MIGIILWSWLAVGFLVGIKFIYVDQELTEEKVKKSVEEMRAKGKNPPARTIEMASNKGIVLALNTLAGYYALYSYTKGIIQKRKKK